MAGLLVHEWIEPDGGSEKVLDSMSALFPDAPIYCLWNNAPGRYDSDRVVESPLARSPLRGRKALALAAMPRVWKTATAGEQKPDWILASSHAFAHHFGAHPRYRDVKRLAYVHTPARYIWAPESDVRGTSLVARATAPFFKRVDRAAAQHVDEFAANSLFVRERIQRAWDREALVIYPPVAVEELQAVSDWRNELSGEELRVLETLPAQFILGASRLVSYKRLDVVIDAGMAVGVPVVIAGSGPERAALEQKAADAAVPVHFVGRVSDAMLRALYQLALVFVFPPVEDFGIMPVEAMALGTPVLVNALGGASESVSILQGGVAIQIESAADLAAAVVSSADQAASIRVSDADAEFGLTRFADSVQQWVERHT